jgi:hypothetical protein
LCPADADPSDVGLSVLSQLSQPLSALITGFVQAFETLANAYDETAPATSTEEILQMLALDFASGESE